MTFAVDYQPTRQARVAMASKLIFVCHSRRNVMDISTVDRAATRMAVPAHRVVSINFDVPMDSVASTRR